jgi:indole-3-acetate monooxygenase
VPRALGGPELSLAEYFAVIEAVSTLDGSVGWVVSNGAGMSRVAGYVDAAVARRWFGNPRAFMVSATGATGTAVPVAGGYRVTGRWPFGSGIHDATLAMGLCALPDGTPRCCVFARDALQVIDTWHVSGLRGTGSCDFAVEDLFVPAEHTYAHLAPAATQPGTLYRMPAITVYPITVSVVPLGIARAAIDALATLAHKIRLGTTQPLRDREMIQAEVGRAEALLGAARAFLLCALDELTAATAMGGPRLLEARVRLRLACTHAGETAARVVSMMATASGTASIFETSILERCVRDVHAATKHIAMSPNSYVIGGRVALGLDPGTVRI